MPTYVWSKRHHYILWFYILGIKTSFLKSLLSLNKHLLCCVIKFYIMHMFKYSKINGILSFKKSKQKTVVCLQFEKWLEPIVVPISYCYIHPAKKTTI